MKSAIVLLVVGGFVGTALAFDVPIDDFENAVNTTPPLISIAGSAETATDVDVPGVLGGSRELLVQGVGGLPILTESGVIAGGLLDYMSIGTGISRVTYDGGGEGIRNAIACAEAIEVAFQDADEAAQGVGTGVTQITVALDGVAMSQPVNAAAGVLSFALEDFVGPDVTNLSMIEVTIDGSVSDSADLALVNIVAVGCEPPEVPSPAMGPGPLALGTLILTGLGLLGVARRRSL